MNISRRHLKTLTIAVLAGLAVFSVFALIMKIFFDYPQFNPTAYITAIALLAIAILTIVYTLMASGQLELMKKQLDEMQSTRQLDSQPLTVLDVSDICIEPPSIFYSPSGDEHDFHTRIRVHFTLKNHTSYPAVNVIAAGAIALNGSKKPTIVSSTPKQVDILPAEKTYPEEDDNDARLPDFFFRVDKENDMLTRFQKKTADLLPVLQAHIVYRNILGACFAVDVAFRLMPAKQEDEEMLKKWQSLIVSFPVEHKEELEKTAALKKDKKETQWKRQLTSMQKETAKKTGEDDLQVSWERLPDSFRVKHLSMEEYKEELETLSVNNAR